MVNAIQRKSDNGLNCPPVLFLIYNRPELTKRVFEHICLSKPKKLFVAADGPSSYKENDYILCDKARDVIKNINWDCNLQTLYRNQNLGCKIAISSAITWFLDHVEAGIILEDDCVPDISFYYYCEELLERYKNDTRIGIISGDSFLKGQEFENSYYFSNFPHIWGWATWKRTWKNYDSSIKDWPQYRNLDWLEKKTGSKKYARIWFNIFDKVHRHEIDTWDYQVAFMLWTQNQLSIVPNRNLVSNIGFGIDSTHTKDTTDKTSMMALESMVFPLIHPQLIYRDLENDLLESRELFGSSLPLTRRFINKIKKFGR